MHHKSDSKPIELAKYVLGYLAINGNVMPKFGKKYAHILLNEKI